MCREVFEMVCQMNMKDVETRMALQCAPVIEGIKISNLLIVPAENGRAVWMILRNSGISCFRLLEGKSTVTFLLFRRQQLECFLNQERAQEILYSQGYREKGLGVILRRFGERYQAYMEQGGSFPHEMGLLLGYPVEDVQGFMEHGGQQFLYSGYWKVYENVPEKKKTFQSFEDARERMVQRLWSGCRIRELIVGQELSFT